jgi:hypothetical protein
MLNRVSFIQHFWWVVAVLLAISYPAQADLIFTSPPREGGGGSNTKADDIYDPLASYLSKILGQKVVYENPGNWFNYQRQMREDKYDIVFDGPHFISWRIEHVQHEAIARMPGPLGFVLLARADDTEINKIDDLYRLDGVSRAHHPFREHGQGRLPTEPLQVVPGEPPPMRVVHAMPGQVWRPLGGHAPDEAVFQAPIPSPDHRGVDGQANPGEAGAPHPGQNVTDPRPAAKHVQLEEVATGGSGRHLLPGRGGEGRADGRGTDSGGCRRRGQGISRVVEPESAHRREQDGQGERHPQE